MGDNWERLNDHDGKIDFTSLFTHAILPWAVLMDGLSINAIPIRLRHYLEIVLPFGLAYTLWTYLHSLFDLGNPDRMDKDPETNDDVLYYFLDWENEPIKTANVAILLLFVLSPVLQFVIWIVSGFRRRYIHFVGSDAMGYVEMSSVDAVARR